MLILLYLYLCLVLTIWQYRIQGHLLLPVSCSQRTKKCLLINDEVRIFAEIFHHLISLYIIGEKLHSINTRFSLKKMLPYEFEISCVKLYIIIIITIIVQLSNCVKMIAIYYVVNHDNRWKMCTISILQKDVFVVSCDLVTDVALHHLADVHRSHDASLSVLLAPVPQTSADREVVATGAF